MTRLAALAILAPMLPLISAFWGRSPAILASGIGGLLWAVAAALGPGAELQIAVLTQLPLFIMMVLLALRFSRSVDTTKDEQLARDPEVLAEARRRRSALKEAVALREEEERTSLQIYGVAKALAESLSWKDMAPRLSAGIQKIFGAYEFLLYARTEEGDWTLLQRRGNWTSEPPLGPESVQQVALASPPQVRELVPVLSVPIYLSGGQEKVKSGVLFLKSSEGGLSPQRLLECGREFGEQLGVALAKALLFNQMEMHTRYDGLTGTLRRQPFMERLNEELKRASVFHTPFSVLMVDIDHFKAINDSHGHAAGDTVLGRVGIILKESFYETDVVGRYGGEEFIVLLPRSDAEGVLRKAESLRRRFEQEVIPSGFDRLKVTVSIGLSHFPDGGRTADDLIASADRALYRAKESGRNRVVAA